MKTKPSQAGQTNTRKSPPAQIESVPQRPDAAAEFLAAFERALGADVACELNAAAREAGAPLAYFLREAAEQCAADAQLLARTSDGASARLLKVPVDRALEAQLLAAASSLGVRMEELVLSAVAEAATRVAAKPSTPAPTAGDQNPAPGRVSGPPNQAIPVRCESTADGVEIARLSREDGASRRTVVHTLGLLGEAEFDDVELLDYVCEVLDGHRNYLKRVIVPQLPTDSQAQVLELVRYAQEWEHQKAVGGSIAQIQDPLRVDDLPGLAGRLAVSHRDLFLKASRILTQRGVQELLERHFLNGESPLQSVIEWGEVIEIAWRFSWGGLDCNSALEGKRRAAKVRALQADERGAA